MPEFNSPNIRGMWDKEARDRYARDCAELSGHPQVQLNLRYMLDNFYFPTLRPLFTALTLSGYRLGKLVITSLGANDNQGFGILCNLEAGGVAFMLPSDARERIGQDAFVGGLALGIEIRPFRLDPPKTMSFVFNNQNFPEGSNWLKLVFDSHPNVPGLPDLQALQNVASQVTTTLLDELYSAMFEHGVQTPQQLVDQDQLPGILKIFRWTDSDVPPPENPDDNIEDSIDEIHRLRIDVWNSISQDVDLLNGFIEAECGLDSMLFQDIHDRYNAIRSDTTGNTDHDRKEFKHRQSELVSWVKRIAGTWPGNKIDLGDYHRNILLKMQYTDVLLMMHDLAGVTVLELEPRPSAFPLSNISVNGPAARKVVALLFAAWVNADGGVDQAQANLLAAWQVLNTGSETVQNFWSNVEDSGSDESVIDTYVSAMTMLGGLTQSSDLNDGILVPSLEQLRLPLMHADAAWGDWDPDAAVTDHVMIMPRFIIGLAKAGIEDGDALVALTNRHFDSLHALLIGQPILLAGMVAGIVVYVKDLFFKIGGLIGELVADPDATISKWYTDAMQMFLQLWNTPKDDLAEQMGKVMGLAMLKKADELAKSSSSWSYVFNLGYFLGPLIFEVIIGILFEVYIFARVASWSGRFIREVGDAVFDALRINNHVDMPPMGPLRGMAPDRRRHVGDPDSDYTHFINVRLYEDVKAEYGDDFTHTLLEALDDFPNASNMPAREISDFKETYLQMAMDLKHLRSSGTDSAAGIEDVFAGLNSGSTTTKFGSMHELDYAWRLTNDTTNGITIKSVANRQVRQASRQSGFRQTADGRIVTKNGDVLDGVELYPDPDNPGFNMLVDEESGLPIGSLDELNLNPDGSVSLRNSQELTGITHASDSTALQGSAHIMAPGRTSEKQALDMLIEKTIPDDPPPKLMAIELKSFTFGRRFGTEDRTKAIRRAGAVVNQLRRRLNDRVMFEGQLRDLQGARVVFDGGEARNPMSTVFREELENHLAQLRSEFPHIAPENIGFDIHTPGQP